MKVLSIFQSGFPEISRKSESNHRWNRLSHHRMSSSYCLASNTSLGTQRIFYLCYSYYRAYNPRNINHCNTIGIHWWYCLHFLPVLGIFISNHTCRKHCMDYCLCNPNTSCIHCSDRHLFRDSNRDLAANNCWIHLRSHGTTPSSMSKFGSACSIHSNTHE